MQQIIHKLKNFLSNKKAQIYIFYFKNGKNKRPLNKIKESFLSAAIQLLIVIW